MLTPSIPPSPDTPFETAVSLRLQISSDEFKSTSPERSYADFAFCALVLFFIVFSFMG